MTKSLYSRVGVGSFLLASALVEWRPIANTFTLSLNNDEYTYILLILPICIALILMNQSELRAVSTRSIRAGLTFLIAAILVACFAYAWPSASAGSDVRLSISMFAVVLSWVGTFVLWFGTRAARLSLFSLCLLFGIVPPPQSVVSTVVALLQQGSAWAAHILLAGLGVPVLQTGIMLSIPGLTVKVAEECSSIRSSSMLMLTTIVLSQLLLRSSWRKMLLICLAIPLSIAKNGVRICVIAMLGTRVDPGYLTGRLHRQGGVIYFAISLIAICALLWIFRRSEDTSPVFSADRECQVDVLQ